MSWLRVSLAADAPRVDAVAAALEARGAVAVTVSAAGGHGVLEPAPGEVALWQGNRVTGLFDDRGDERSLRERLARELDGAGLGAPEFEPLADTDWSSAWRGQAVEREFGAGLWVVPHDAPAPANARAVLRLDPGLAFGTGGHPTTALCLEWLSRQPLSGARVLDYGCGSGVLAVASALLGATHVLAVDHDPQALEATRENAARNGVSGRIRVAAQPPAASAPDVDVAVANILAGTLRQLEPCLAGRLRPRARLALSGVLEDQAGALARCYEADFAMAAPHVRDGWALLEGRRRG